MSSRLQSEILTRKTSAKKKKKERKVEEEEKYAKARGKRWSVVLHGPLCMRKLVVILMSQHL